MAQRKKVAKVVEPVMQAKPVVPVVEWLKEKQIELVFKPQNNMVIRGNAVVYSIGEIEYNEGRRQRLMIQMIIPTIFTDDIKRTIQTLVIEDIYVLGRYAETLKVQLKPGMVISEFKGTTRTMGGKTVTVLNGFMRWKPTTKPGQITQQEPEGEDYVVDVKSKIKDTRTEQEKKEDNEDALLGHHIACEKEKLRKDGVDFDKLSPETKQEKLAFWRNRVKDSMNVPNDNF